MAASGLVNSRSMLTTGMPARSAFWATGVSAAPSWGSTTSTSGFSAMACSICCACESASAASSSSNSTSSYFSAAALAFFEIAPSQPWSVGGTLAMIVTVLPDPPVEPPVSAPPSAGAVDRDGLGVARRRRQRRRGRARPRATIVMESLQRHACAPPRVWIEPRIQYRASGLWSRTAPSTIAPLMTCWTSVERFSCVMRLKMSAKVRTPEEGPDDRRPAAGEAGAADDDGADGVELVEVAADRRGAAEARAEQDRGDAGEQAGQHVDAEDRPCAPGRRRCARPRGCRRRRRRSGRSGCG